MNEQLNKIITEIILGLGVLLISGFYHGLQAQNSTSAFNELNIGISVQANVNRNIFHRYWDPGPGLQLDFRAPFYVGEVTASGRYFRFDKKFVKHCKPQ